MANKRVMLICDESGAKGYASQKEAYQGEVGVVAGFAVGQGTQLGELKKALSQAISGFQVSKQSKFHITDLANNEQSQLRNLVFRVLKIHNVPLCYGASYVDGFNRDYEQCKSRYFEIVKKAKSNNIGLTNNYIPPLLQGELFFIYLGKTLDFLITHNLLVDSVAVVTDQIDVLIRKEYVKQIERLLNNSSGGTRSLNAFDYDTKVTSRHEIKITIQTDGPVDTHLRSMHSTIEVDDNELTLAADVLSNSVKYYLEKYGIESQFHALNTKAAIKKHPLHVQFVGMHDDPNRVPVIDIKYAHRNSRLNLKTG